jgi:hypothetical protein
MVEEHDELNLDKPLCGLKIQVKSFLWKNDKKIKLYSDFMLYIKNNENLYVMIYGDLKVTKNEEMKFNP